MRISALIMGICPSQRLDWLKESIDFMDMQNFPFHKKVLAIDEYGGCKFPSWLKDNLEARDWVILIDNHKDRVKSMKHALEYTDSHIVFYNEDDVKAWLPSYELITNIFDIQDYDRSCAMLSMTVGGTDMNLSRGYAGDLHQMHKNSIYDKDGRIVFIRDEGKRNAWFFEFPGLFVRDDILVGCMNHASSKFSGQQIEQGLTSAYFDLGLDKDYFKCSILRSRTLNIIKNDPDNLVNRCRFLKNLDPNQGSSPLGGCHHF